VVPRSANATTTSTPSCGRITEPLTPHHSDVFDVNSTECSLTIYSSTGGYLEVTTRHHEIFDVQINSGSTLHTNDPFRPFRTDFALYFGPGEWTIGVSEIVDPQADFHFTLNDRDTGRFPLDASFTPLPGALPLLATVLGAGYLLYGWRRRRAAGSAAFEAACARPRLNWRPF